MTKKNTYVYGQSPNPKSWFEAAQILKNGQSKTKKGSGKTGLYAKLLEIETMLKEKR